jgi:hypothetical protein
MPALPKPSTRYPQWLNKTKTRKSCIFRKNEIKWGASCTQA